MVVFLQWQALCRPSKGKLARVPMVELGGMFNWSLIVLGVLHCKTSLGWQLRGNLGDEDEEDTLQYVRQPNAWESSECSRPEEADDEPVYVGECRSSTSAAPPADEFGTLVVESDDVEYEHSEADNAAGRTKELEALVAISEDIVCRTSRTVPGSRRSSSGEEGDEDEDESGTT